MFNDEEERWAICVHEAAHAVIPAAAIERAIGNAYCRP